MASTTIPVDLLNPGQVFACLGLAEAADILLGEAQGGFDWSDGRGARFVLAAVGEANPVAAVLGFLDGAEVHSLCARGSQHSTANWQVDTRTAQGDLYPFPETLSPATLPCVLRGTGVSGHGKVELTIDHWGDDTCRDNLKFWAGAGGYPGVALARDALHLVRGGANQSVGDPFAVRAAQSSSFRFDWRRDYVPLDVGFSPNEHRGMTMIGFPYVELLAAVGLRDARPCRIHKLAYRYGILGGVAATGLYPLPLLRAALGASPLPFPRRLFRMTLGWPGQENQARCINHVIEEAVL